MHLRKFSISRAIASPWSLPESSHVPALLIAARAVQGLGGAIVSAVALSLIMLLFTEADERAKAMGVIGFVAGVPAAAEAD